jgi:hypothetical protein
MLEVMSTSVYIGLNPFNFIHKHFLQIFVRIVAVYLKQKDAGSDVQERRYKLELECIIAQVHSDFPNALFEHYEQYGTSHLEVQSSQVRVTGLNERMCENQRISK